MTCRWCDRPIGRRLNKKRRYCGDKCRHAYHYQWRSVRKGIR